MKIPKMNPNYEPMPRNAFNFTRRQIRQEPSVPFIQNHRIQKVTINRGDLLDLKILGTHFDEPDHTLRLRREGENIVAEWVD